MIALGRRFASPTAFNQARLTPSGYFGLHLTLDASITIGAGWLFGGITEDLVNGDPLTVLV